MTKTTGSFVHLATFLLLGAAVSSLAAPPAAAQKVQPPQDVHVINAAADPVPVKIDPTTNTVKIDGATNTVKASQTGAWSVGITGTPTVVLSGAPTVSLASGATVQLGNTAASPAIVRNVDRASAQPFRMTLNATFSAGFAATSPTNSLVVPAGKHLVIEFVTVLITLPNGQASQFARLDASGPFNEYLLVTAVGNDGAGKANFVGTHRVFVILEPGMSVNAFAIRNGGTDSGTVAMTVSGYLEDI
jgi:hypothetical protein